MSLISIKTELLDSGVQLASASKEIAWEGGVGSHSIHFSMGDIFNESDVSIELTAKFKPDGSAGGFVRVKNECDDLALWSYFCRAGLTESMGIRLAGGAWLRLSISNRK